MSWSLPFIFLLYFLRVQSMDLTDAWSISSLSGFAVPEIDGSAVDDTCRIFFVTTPETPTKITTTSPVTRKQVAATTKKPAVQSQPKQPQTKDTGAPVRTQAAAGRLTNSHSNPAVSLLYYLLANRRGQTGRYGVAKSSAAWKVGSFSSEDSSDES